MREFIELGPVPSEENCFQTGKDDFCLIKGEAKIFKHMLERLFPDVYFSVRTFDHEFGQYCEVVVYYEDEDEEQVDKAFAVDSCLPKNWDVIAKKELEELVKNYKQTQNN